MGKDINGLVAMCVLSAMAGMKNSIMNYTSGFHWNDKSYDMNSINKARKKNRKKRSKK